MISFAHGFCHSNAAHQLIICANIKPYPHFSLEPNIKLSCQLLTSTLLVAHVHPRIIQPIQEVSVQEMEIGHNEPSFIIVFFVTIFHRLSEIFSFACKFEFIDITSFSVLISIIFAGAGFTVNGIFKVSIPGIDIDIISSHALKVGIR
jgi:hypothetical protein